MTVRLVSMDASSVHGQAWPHDQIRKEGRRRLTGWARPGRGRAWPFCLRPSFFGVARTAANLRCLGRTTTAAVAAMAHSERQPASADGGDGGGDRGQCTRPCTTTAVEKKQGIEADVECPVFAQSRPSDANCIFGRLA